MENQPAIPTAIRAPGRFLRRRWMLLPTWRLSLIVAVAIGCPAIFAFLHLYEWLAVSDPAPGARIMIVEGWIPDHALQQAAERARQTGADAVYCTGVPLDRGTLDLPYQTFAEYAAATLVKMGVPAEKVHAAPCPLAKTERTRQMARTLASGFLNAPGFSHEKKADIITYATHSRRTRAIFREELGSGWQLGVITYPDPEAEPSRWYLSSKSAKDVFSEMVALTMGVFGGN